MTRLFNIGLICLIFSSAYGQDKTLKPISKSNTPKPLALNFDTSKIAILNLKSDRWLIQKFDTEKSFNLNDSDLKVADEIFNKCVIQNNLDTSYFHYKRQYVPFTDKDGQKKIWVNCFCPGFDNDFPYWKKSIVLVYDGGSCFFNFIINLADKSYSNFEVNGVA